MGLNEGLVRLGEADQALMLEEAHVGSAIEACKIGGDILASVNGILLGFAPQLQAIKQCYDTAVDHLNQAETRATDAARYIQLSGIEELNTSDTHEIIERSQSATEIHNYMRGSLAGEILSPDQLLETVAALRDTANTLFAVFMRANSGQKLPDAKKQIGQARAAINRFRNQKDT